jgi:hypothetical protein
MEHFPGHQIQSLLKPGFPDLEPSSGSFGSSQIFTPFKEISKITSSLFGRMSPSGQPNSASRRSKIVRQPSIVPIVQTEPGAVGLVAAKKKRRFDPHAFLATIAEGRKFVLFPVK